GAKVTLRGDRMWEFLDRLLSLALPRIRDFRGLSAKQFDGHGNSTFGLNEQSMFREIDVDRIDRQRGMDITLVTTATNDDEGRELLRQLGFPFAGVPVVTTIRSAGRRKENGQEGSDREGEPQAQVRRPWLHPLPAVRTSALGVPQVRPVPDLPAGDGPCRGAPGRAQVQLVSHTT